MLDNQLNLNLNTETEKRRPLKIFRVSFYEWYAHYSLDEAIKYAVESYGDNATEDEVIDEDYCHEDMDAKRLIIDDENDLKISFEDHLKTFTGPGYFCGTEQ